MMTRRAMGTVVAVLGAGALLALAAGAGGAQEAGFTPGRDGAGAVVRAYSHPVLGNIVTDREGRVLYVFLRDEPGAASTCDGPCADRWPPLVVGEGEAVGGDGVGGELGVIRRADGRLQVTYGGMPLYRWHQDREPGDATGQGVGGIWFVVPADPAVTAPPTVEMARRADGTEYVVDTYGRTLYMFTRDAAGESACYDGCARNWPPVVGQPAPAGAVTAAVGTTRRTDGTVQATLAGMPLYYYAGDRHPGEANGHGFRDVWYVLSPGGAVIEGAAATEAGPPAGGAANGTGGASGAAEVAIRGFAYGPEELTVPVGTTVVWTNGDAVPHTVTSAEEPQTLNSPLLGTGGQFRFTFSEPGRYPYMCTLHPEMRGVIIVR